MAEGMTAEEWARQLCSGSVFLSVCLAATTKTAGDLTEAKALMIKAIAAAITDAEAAAYQRGVYAERKTAYRKGFDDGYLQGSELERAACAEIARDIRLGSTDELTAPVRRTFISWRMIGEEIASAIEARRD